MEDLIEVKIEKLVAGGEGLAHHNGKAIFIPFSIPGEKVCVKIARNEKDWIKGEIIEILEPSKERIQPLCPHFGFCGGCNLQHINYLSQLELKKQIVAENLKRIGKLEIPDFSMVESIPFAYRNRMQFHVDKDGSICFMRTLTSATLKICTCPVAVKPIRNWIESFSRSFRPNLNISPFLQAGSRFLVFSPDREGEKVFIEGKDGEVSVIVHGRPIQFHIKGFFQSNLYLFDKLVTSATSHLEGEHALDLYSGSGPFATFLVDSFKSVTVVEQNPFALEYARRNVKGSGDFYSMSAEEWVESTCAKQKYDAVICDPPRSGLSDRVKSWLIKSKPDIISYVSCDSATCARDIGELVKSGYSIGWIKVFDFYPQTGHTELCVRLVYQE